MVVFAVILACSTPDACIMYRSPFPMQLEVCQGNKQALVELFMVQMPDLTVKGFKCVAEETLQGSEI